MGVCVSFVCVCVCLFFSFVLLSFNPPSVALSSVCLDEIFRANTKMASYLFDTPFHQATYCCEQQQVEKEFLAYHTRGQLGL